MFNNKKSSKKDKDPQYWEAERRAAYFHAQKLSYHDYHMSNMDKQIQEERAKTKQLQEQKLLQRAKEQSTIKPLNNTSSVTATPFNVAAGVTSSPSSSISSTSKPAYFTSATTFHPYPSTEAFEAFKQQPPRSVSTPPPIPPRHFQAVETQTMSVSMNSVETQTPEVNYYSFQNEPTPTYNFTDIQIERKPKPISFPPRLKLPSMSLDNDSSSTAATSSVTPPSVISPSCHHNTEIGENTVPDASVDRFEIMKRQQQQEANERKRKEEEQLQALKMAVQNNPIKIPNIMPKSVPKYSHETQMPSSPIRRNSVPSIIHQQIGTEIKLKSVENVKVVAPGIGVIGLPKSGRSFLIGALAGGIWPRDLGTENPVISKNGTIYKLNHPNNGFINGSVNENRPIYEHFFQTSTLSKLSILILTIDGAVREEDYLILCLAKQYNIPTVIVRTKLDEWLDNLPSGQTKDEYVQKDKEFVINSLQDLNIQFLKNQIFNVSALSMITIAEDGIKSEMTKYEQDDKALLKLLNEHGFGDYQQPVSYDQSKLIAADIVILGLKGSGKSAIAECLKQQFHLSKRGKSINETEYDETMKIDEMIQKLSNLQATLYILLVPNTVGRMDAELTKYLSNSNKSFCVLLNKSDEMMDNLRKQQRFYGNEDYAQKRLEAAQLEFVKVNINPEILPCFSVSAFALSGYLHYGYLTHEQNFLNFVANVLNLQV